MISARHNRALFDIASVGGGSGSRCTFFIRFFHFLNAAALAYMTSFKAPVFPFIQNLD
jgi:hypothetical protein